MTDFKKWRIALIAGLAVPALALSACSSDDDSDSDSGSGSADSASDSTDDSGSTDDSDSGSTDASDSDSDSDSGSGSDAGLEDAPDDFDLTDPGSKLSLGDDAYVVTQQSADEGTGDTHPIQYWKITAQDLTDVPKEDVQLSEDANEVEKFICVNYDMEYLGSSEPSDPESTEIVMEPSVTAVDDSGTGANSVMMADPADCDIHESDSLPSGFDELQEGKVYKGAELSYETNDGTGVTATGLEFRYEVDIEDLENADSIYWN